MCRNKDERAERCDCDTNEARRLRSQNSKAKKRYAGLVTKLIPANFLPSLKRQESLTTEEVESIVREEIKELNGIRKILLNSTDVQAVTLITYDNILNSIGSGVEFIAEKRYNAPTDEEFLETFDIADETYEKYRKESRKSGHSKTEAHSYAEEKAYDEVGQEILGRVGVLFERRNDAIRKALTDVGVQFANPDTIRFSENSDKQAVTSLKNALIYYPQSWVDISNKSHESRPLRIRDTEERAHYAPYMTEPDGFTYSELNVSRDADSFVGKDTGMTTALHEFAHRIEHTVKWVKGSEEIFLMRRAGHLPSADYSVSKPEKLSLIYPDEDGEKEFGYKDNFPDHYMGKVYDKSKHREILSTGMESLFGGSYGGFSGIFKFKQDAHFKRFILGMLASSVD